MNAAAELRLAMLGMVPGNGHPYSWSAIVNGYDPELMQSCPYPVIAQYLGKQNPDNVRIPGARVTHIWTDDPADAPRVAAASRIAHVVKRPEDVIGKVDAVVIATDDGNDHILRSRPFIEAGLPVFIDKPLASNMPDLRQFVTWQRGGKRLLSTSGLRYAPEIASLPMAELGDLRWITSFTCKSWERYGIHALEGIYPLMGPGFISVRSASKSGSDVVHLHHRNGVEVTLAAINDAYGSFAAMHIYGTKGHRAVTHTDTYTAFRRQLVTFIDFVRTGELPFPFDETIELMLIIIAGIRSREQNGAEVPLAQLRAELACNTTTQTHPTSTAGERR